MLESTSAKSQFYSLIPKCDVWKTLDNDKLSNLTDKRAQNGLVFSQTAECMRLQSFGYHLKLQQVVYCCIDNILCRRPPPNRSKHLVSFMPPSFLPCCHGSTPCHWCSRTWAGRLVFRPPSLSFNSEGMDVPQFLIHCQISPEIPVMDPNLSLSTCSALLPIPADVLRPQIRASCLVSPLWTACPHLIRAAAVPHQNT